MTQQPMPERYSELASDRALTGLDAAEALELERLMREQGADEASELELAAAELDLALAQEAREPLSESMRAALARAGEQWNAARKQESAAEAFAGEPTPAPARRAPGLQLVRWLITAAAAIAVVFAWLRDPPSTDAPDPQHTYAQLRTADGSVNPLFTATEHAPGASGDVVWSQAGQAGVLHLVGLPTNDPKVEQYQLWIVDAEQKQPIDGGVFDVAGGEGWIAIDPKLAVARPTAFAITLEKPGGVVVSAQERVVLLATL